MLVGSLFGTRVLGLSIVNAHIYYFLNAEFPISLWRLKSENQMSREKGIEVMYVSEVWFYFDLHWLWDFGQSQLLWASQFP